MQVFNLTSKTYLTKDIKKVKTLKDKTFGLFRKSNPRSLLFKTRFGLHTLFLSEPVDIILLDKDYKVVKMAINSQNKFFIYSPVFSNVLELPASSIKKSKTKIGDRLKLI